MDIRPSGWVDPLMRCGYAARGIVYVLVGALAFVAAVDGGRTPDSTSALATLFRMPFGTGLLALVALGLAAYAAYALIDGLFDLDDKGSDVWGWAGRLARIVSGALHLALGFSVVRLLVGLGTDGDDRTDHWTGVLMQQPAGRWLVAIIGVFALALSVQQFRKALRESYKEHLRRTTVTERLDPVLKLGLMAHGIVIVIVGSFFLWSAWTANPERAGGMREAFLLLRSLDHGQLLFAIVGLGLLGFAAYCFIIAGYSVVPRCKPLNFDALGSKARAAVGSR